MQSESPSISARESPRRRVPTRSWSRVRSEIFWSEARSRLSTAGSANSRESRVSGGYMLSSDRVDACASEQGDFDHCCAALRYKTRVRSAFDDNVHATRGLNALFEVRCR